MGNDLALCNISALVIVLAASNQSQSAQCSQHADLDFAGQLFGECLHESLQISIERPVGNVAID
jgi:hypothetical protein